MTSSSPCSEPTNDPRQQREKHDGEYHRLDVPIDAWNVAAQEVADEQHTPDPPDAAEHVVERIAPVVHGRHTGHDRNEGPHDRHKSRNDHRLAAVPLVELVCPIEMLLVEEQRILTAEQTRAGHLADRVAGGIAE